MGLHNTYTTLTRDWYKMKMESVIINFNRDDGCCNLQVLVINGKGPSLRSVTELYEVTGMIAYYSDYNYTIILHLVMNSYLSHCLFAK